MLASLILAAQAAAAQPAPPAPAHAEVHYVGVPGVEARALKLLQAHAERSPAAGRIAPASIAPPPFERCADTPAARMHRIDTLCIRGLVPEAPAGTPPVIALAVVEDRRPNITGRIVLKGHTIYCIGARAVGFEDLNDPLDGRGTELRLQAKIDECIADALSTERFGRMERDREGRRRWVYAFTSDRLAASPQEARGSADGIATVRVGRLIPNPRGLCRAHGVIEEVESGSVLRSGDRITIELPRLCVRGLPTTEALARPGALVRFYGAWGGGVRFLEPIADGQR